MFNYIYIYLLEYRQTNTQAYINKNTDLQKLHLAKNIPLHIHTYYVKFLVLEIRTISSHLWPKNETKEIG